MFAELIQKIEDLANKAHGPHVVKPPGSPEFAYLLQDKDGDVREMNADPMPRKHVAGSLFSLVEFARERNNTKDPIIWYNRNKIVVILDDDTRRDTVTMPLVLSKQIQLLTGMEGRCDLFKQKDLLLSLRTNFKSCMTHCESLVDLLRSVKFDNGQVVEGTVQHGKSSLGTKIRSEVTALDRIPEYVTFVVPVFESGFPDLAFPVELALEPVPESCGFKLMPLPGEIERAISQAENEIGVRIRNMLGDVAIPAYYGTP